MNSLERQLLESPSLPTLPTVAQRILELVRDERTDLSQLASVISCDPSLTARVLGLINSPMYRMSREIVSLREAVLYLGMNAVRSVALSFSLIATLRGESNRSSGLDQLWRTSLMNALAARRLATETGGWDPEEAFLAGLMADCGALLMYKMVPDYPALVARFHAGEADLVDLERANLETDHTRMIQLLLESWNFPEPFRAVLGAQHDPSQLDRGSPGELHARILNAAWLCARALTVPGFATDAAMLDQHVSVLLGLSPTLVRAIASEVPDELRETARFFDIPAGEQKSFDQLLEDANRALGTLALAADLAASPGIRTLLEETEQSDELSREISLLLEHEEDSRLASRASFERLLEVVHKRARETRSSLAVILLELAEWKPLEGDQDDPREEVLGEVAGRLEAGMRPSDRLARFSLDQIAILLPGCPADALRRTASRVQAMLEREPIHTEAGPVECRMGIGAAASTPDRDGIDPRTLLSLASSAVDRSLSSADRIVIAT